jgi:hypothetical protein
VGLPTASTEVHDVQLEATVQAVLGDWESVRRVSGGGGLAGLWRRSQHCFR